MQQLMKTQFGELTSLIKLQSAQMDDRLALERQRTEKQFQQMRSEFQKQFRQMREDLERSMAERGTGGPRVNPATLESAEAYGTARTNFNQTPTIANARAYVRTLTPTGINALAHHLNTIGNDDFPSFMGDFERTRKRMLESREATMDTIATTLGKSPCQVPSYEAIKQIARDQHGTAKSTPPTQSAGFTTAGLTAAGSIPGYVAPPMAPPTFPQGGTHGAHNWRGIPHGYGRTPHDNESLHRPTQNKEKAVEAVNSFLLGKPDSTGLTLTTIRKALGGVHSYSPTNLRDRSQFAEAVSQLQNHIHQLDAEKPNTIKQKQDFLLQLMSATKYVTSLDNPAHVEAALNAWQEGMLYERSFAGSMFKTTVAVYLQQKKLGKSSTSSSTSTNPRSTNTRSTPTTRLCSLCKTAGHYRAECPYTYNGKQLPETVLCDAYNRGTCPIKRNWMCSKAHICSVCRTPAATHPKTQCQRHLH